MLKAICCFNDGNWYYGEFNPDIYKMEGKGTFFWAVGDTYIGDYKNHLRHGEGTYYYKD